MKIMVSSINIKFLNKQFCFSHRFVSHLEGLNMVLSVKWLNDEIMEVLCYGYACSLHAC